jgi:hypothetical protein
MAYFQPFQKATGPKTPQFIAAEIGQAAADNAEKARINEIRAQNQAGAASVYKGVTSKMEKDPIAEALRGGWDKMAGGGADGGAMLNAAGETVGSLAPQQALTAAEVASEAALADAGIGGATTAALTEAGGAVAGGTTAGGTGLMAALASNPVGWGVGAAGLLAALLANR